MYIYIYVYIYKCILHWRFPLRDAVGVVIIGTACSLIDRTCPTRRKFAHNSCVRLLLLEKGAGFDFRIHLQHCTNGDHSRHFL